MAKPFQPGELIVVEGPEEDRLAVVSALVETDSAARWRRWRLLCRWVDRPDSTVDIPLHCGDDGIGERVRPAPAASGQAP